MVPNILTAIIAAFLTVVTAEYGAMPGLSPRYDLGQAAHLVNRQTGVCPKANQHTCLDIGFGSACCDNNNYCIVANNTASCCFIGSTCANLCDANHYECPVTVTVSSTVTVTTSCCGRSCTSTSAYLCASALGGQCCNYDSGCAANSQCAASTTSSNIASSTGSSAGPSPTGGSAPPSSSGLSTGAKAGIGAGVAGGALVVIAGLLWFCTFHRRRAKIAAASVPGMSQGSETGTKRPSLGKSGSDYFGPTAAHGPFTEPHDSAATSPGAYRGVPVSPQGPGDITVPVEIDSRDSRGQSDVTTPGAFEYVKGPCLTVEPVEMP